MSPDGSTDRRFPTQRFVTADWTSPITNRLLLEASGIHRVERWGNMHLQTGKGENIDAITPGMISVTDDPNPVTGGSLTYPHRLRSTTTRGTGTSTTAAAMSYITGSHNIKVGFNNAYLHHENTTYTDPSAPYIYTFASGVPTTITIESRHGRSQVERGSRLRRVRAGSLDGRPMDASGRRPLRRVREQLPGTGDRADAASRRRSISGSTPSTT